LGASACADAAARLLRAVARCQNEKTMSDVEPQKVAAIRSVIADLLGLDPSDVEVIERAAPGSSDDEPYFVTVLIPRKEGVTEEAAETAVVTVNKTMSSHPAYPTQLRWQFKD
jgi:hypothetical protein